MFFISPTRLRLFRAATIFLCITFCTAVNFAQSTSPSQAAGAIDPRGINFKDTRYLAHPPTANFPFSASDYAAKSSTTSAGELDTSFNAEIFSAPGLARSSAIQPDGKILVGGYFRTLNNTRSDNLVRLNIDNSIDSSFTARVNGTIIAIALQPDGKILIGGEFTTVNNIGRNRIARLNPDGSLDTSFNPGTGADGVVYDIAVQVDGKILIGGNFYGINGTSSFAVSRLDFDGSVDSSFSSPIPSPAPQPPGNPPQTPSIVFALAVQPDGKILLGGLIVRSYSPTFNASPIARLNADGGFDLSFAAGNFNSDVYDIAVQPDGKIVVAGFFTTIGGVTRNRIARLNADGSLDTAFDPGTGADFPVYAIYLQTNGSLLIGGLFRNFNGTARRGVARLNPNGTLDETFAPVANTFLRNSVFTVIQTLGGKVLTGASTFTFDAANKNTIIFYNANGSLDNTSGYNSTVVGGVRAVAAQPDGKILVGGFFNRVNNVLCNGLARLNTDGTLDQTFNLSSASSGRVVNSIVLQPDGKILVGGSRVNSGGSLTIYNVARFNIDGTVDSSFTQGDLPFNRITTDIALQPNGKIVIIYNRPGVDGNELSGIARLNSDGSIDSSFNSTLSASLNAVAVQPDEKVLVGGSFGFCSVSGGNGVCYFGVVRLNADGALDETFQTDFSANPERFSRVYALALQPDGKILAGGNIFVGNSAPGTGVVRLNPNGMSDSSFNAGSISSRIESPRVEDLLLLPSGKILVGGRFDNSNSTPQNNVARLEATGTLDPSFNAATDGAVYDLAVQPDGKILLGGDFETVNNTPRTVVARLLSEPPVATRRTLFDFDGDGKADVSVFRPADGAWYLLRSQAGFANILFGAASDKLAPADYDGDGKTDVAVFRDGTWYVLQSANNQILTVPFGQTGDVPVPADYDGDGRADIAVFRDGNWYRLNSGNGQFVSLTFGVSTDKSVPADYDGDGKADVAVYRNGVWYMQQSNDGFRVVSWGASTDIPVTGDYDGDGRADQAVYRSGGWYIFGSQQGALSFQFGNATDLPTPADYDGDGKTDIGVYRAGSWYLQRSVEGFTSVQFGAANDKPLPNAFVP